MRSRRRSFLFPLVGKWVNLFIYRMTCWTHWKLLYSLLQSVTAKWDRLKSAKGSDALGWVQETSKDAVFNGPLPVESWTTPLSRKQCVTICMEFCQAGKLTEDLLTREFTGASCSIAHIAGLSPASVEIKLIPHNSQTYHKSLCYTFWHGPKSPGEERHTN